MMRFVFDYWVLICTFFVIVWFVCKYLVADLPDDVLSQSYKRIKQAKKEADDGRLRDHR